MLAVVAGTYYVDLFISKDVYTREELKSVLPWLGKIWKTLTGNYPVPVMIGVLLGSSFIGIVIPRLFSHWIISSSLLLVIFFFVMPYIKKHLEQSKVTSSEDYTDNAANFFVKFNDIFLFGFGFGLGAVLIYNWASVKSIIFLWFLPNIVVVAVLLGISLRNAIRK